MHVLMHVLMLCQNRERDARDPARPHLVPDYQHLDLDLDLDLEPCLGPDLKAYRDLGLGLTLAPEPHLEPNQEHHQIGLVIDLARPVRQAAPNPTAGLDQLGLLMILTQLGLLGQPGHLRLPTQPELLAGHPERDGLA